MYKILIPDRLTPPADVEQRVFGDMAEITVSQATHTNQIPDEVWANTDAVLAWHDLEFTPEVLDKLVNCKVIVRVGVGFDNVHLDEAATRGISVCTVPDYGVHDVADHTMGLLLSLARGLSPCNDLAKTGVWDWKYASGLRRLTDTTLGIVGLGRIGGAVGHRARAFGMRILFYDPYQPVGIEKAWGFDRCWEIEEIARQCHAISVHTPLTPETNGIIGAEFLGACVHSPLLINTARGPIVDNEALYETLVSGQVSGAGLDVLMEEPPNPKSRLVRAWLEGDASVADKLIITPHCAFCNVEALEEMRRKAAEEAIRVLEGGCPRSCVNSNGQGKNSGQ